MSDVFGFSSEVDLAKAVVDASENERREMLKRYYVGKNPVLSGLSTFTETSSVEDLNKERLVKGGKRSLESARKDDSHRTPKRSKRNLPKRKSKPLQVKPHGNEASCKEILERQKVNHLVGESTSRSKQTRCPATTSEGKQRTHRESPNHGPTVNEVEVNSADRRDFGLAESGPSHLPRTNLIEQKDVKSSSTQSKSDEVFVAETQSSSLENTSEFPVSILDEFLMRESSRLGREIKGSGRRVDKRKQCSSKKEAKQLDKTDEKGTSKLKKNSTSVLDEFI